GPVWGEATTTPPATAGLLASAVVPGVELTTRPPWRLRPGKVLGWADPPPTPRAAGGADPPRPPPPANAHTPPALPTQRAPPLPARGPPRPPRAHPPPAPAAPRFAHRPAATRHPCACISAGYGSWFWGSS